MSIYGPGHITNMAAIPIFGKYPSKIFSGAKRQRIIDGLGLIRLFFRFPERCIWASSVVHVVSVQ